MKKDGIVIEYGDIAPNAKENFEPTANEQAEFSKIEQLKEYNVTFPNYGNPCEYGAVPLNSTMQPLDEDGNIGYWSENVSNEMGVFDTPIVLTFVANGLYSSAGFTLTFDDINDIFSTDINIKWYNGDSLLDEKDFAPDSATYFCENRADNFDKFVITFYSLNMPYNRLKIKSIEYGQGVFFYGDELRNVNINQEIDPLSSEISINTCDFTLDSKQNRVFDFQTKQPFKVYFNGKLRNLSLVKNAKRTSENMWNLQTEDYIGLLEDTTFLGGMYGNVIWLAGASPSLIRDITAGQLLEEIFTEAGVPFYIESDIYDIPINGHLPVSSARAATSQICFAIGAVCDTSNSDVVNVYKRKDNITQTIPLNRIMQGQNFEHIETVTSVNVSTFAYSTELAVDPPRMYDTNAGDPTGENILIIFNEPHSFVGIDNKDGRDYIKGRIIKSGINFAIADIGEGDYIEGENLVIIPYRVERRKNPNALANTKEKVINITEATLVDANNVDDVADRCFNYYAKTTKTNLKIVEGKTPVKFGQAKYGEIKYGESLVDSTVNVGETITAETQYLGNVTGTIISQKYNLNGNIIVKECIMI